MEEGLGQMTPFVRDLHYAVLFMLSYTKSKNWAGYLLRNCVSVDPNRINYSGEFMWQPKAFQGQPRHSCHDQATSNTKSCKVEYSSTRSL